MIVRVLLTISLLATPHATPYDVKGVSLGTSLADLREQLGPDLECGKPADKESFATMVCYVKVPGRSPLQDLGRLDDTFAGHPTRIFYSIWNDRVGVISISSLPSDSFDEIVANMRSKYGEPAEMRTETVRTRDNAEHENQRVIWRGGGVIRYEKLWPTNIRISDLDFYSDAYWAELERRRAERSEQAKQDM